MTATTAMSKFEVRSGYQLQLARLPRRLFQDTGHEAAHTSAAGCC